jgi:hypothetical protein
MILLIFADGRNTPETLQTEFKRVTKMLCGPASGSADGLRSATAFLRKSNFRGQSDAGQRPVLGHLARQSKIAFRRR